MIPLTKRLPTGKWCLNGPASIQAHVACSSVIICVMVTVWLRIDLGSLLIGTDSAKPCLVHLKMKWSALSAGRLVLLIYFEAEG